jgi:carbon monoxide dehydrogenase subunit G
MDNYESKITRAEAEVSDVYGVLSNLKNLDRVKNLIPEDKVSDIETTDDTIRFKVNGMGQKVCVRIVEREENKTIKFAVDNLPLTANSYIQTKQVAENDTRLKLTLRAEIPTMIRMMFASKIQQGLDTAADMMAQFPYKQWNNQ